MKKFTSQVSQLATKYQVAIVHPLILLVLSFSISSTTVAATGYPLIDTLTGKFGDATNYMKDEVNRLVEESGIEAAATQAQTTLNELAEGAVPVIDDLKEPYQDKAEEAIALAVNKVQIATQILNKIAGPGAKKAIDFLQNSPLFEGADFGISTATGRIRIRVQNGEVSLCRTIVGPLGSIIVTGISNAEKLCHFPDQRMSNPTKSLIAFTYIAAGHTHIRTSRVLVPNPFEDLTLLPAPIDAATYVKTIGGQWVQIRLAGADPKSMTMEAKFEVGVKGNFSYVVDVEVEGEAALKITDLKPIYAAEIIRSTGEAMLDKATSLGLEMKARNLASNAAAILKAGLQHLSDIEPQYEEGFGNVSIDTKLTGGIGVGAWDTGISLLSANSTFNLTAPLVAFIEMRAGLLEEFLDAGMSMANVNLNLATSVLERKQDTLVTYKAGVQAVTKTFFDGVLTELLEMSTQITSIESTFKLAVLGDADKESTAIYESGLKLPVGVISTNLQMEPNPLGSAFEAISYLLLAAVDPEADITDETWTDLEQVIVPGIEFTLLARNPITFSMFGFREADLLETIKTIATVREVLISVVSSSVKESLADLRAAMENAIERATTNITDNDVITWLNQTEIVKSISFGANGALGAEVVGELGASIGIEGKVSGSLFMLLLDLPIYQMPNDPEKPQHKGLLASTSMPVDFSLDLGASAGEGVELTVDAGGKLNFNLFELTVKHWEDDLPTSAMMKVAGFSVLEFDGSVHQDESFEGSGYLMLPMGGIVHADFSVDEFSNVTNGSWSGGVELGPLGYFPFIKGTLDNDGLHGTVNVGLLGSSFNARFILQSSGLLLGSYDGAINIAGHELAAANLYLGTDGEFIGHYQGNLSIGGFVATSELDFSNDGVAGSSELTIFGSGLTSTDIGITRSGMITGTFTGEIIAGTHTLSGVTLQAVNGGFIGTALMDLPGVAGAEVELRIFDGKITALYQGDLFNGLISQASFAISDSGVVISSNFNTSQFPGISSQVLDLVVAASSLAQDGLQLAKDDLAAAQLGLDTAELNLNNASSQLAASLEAAQLKVINATADVQTALQELDTVVAKIDELNIAYKRLIDDAQRALNVARDAYNRANNLVNFYNNEIRNLDNWYKNLNAYNKAKKLAYYTARRAQLVTYLTAAIVNRTAEKVTLDAAQLVLNTLNSKLADLLNPFELSRAALQTAHETANGILITARQELASIEASIVADTALQPLYAALDAARTRLTIAQELVNKLSGTIAMAEYFATQGAEGAFNVETANLTIDLTTLMNSSSVKIDARVTFLGQQGRISLALELANPVNSFHQAVTDIHSGKLLISNSDVTAPTVTANLPAEWSSNQTLIQLIAKDNQTGTGIASISYSATGAQILSDVTIAGKEAFALVNVEGLTLLSFYATDISGNVSETTTISINIDNIGPEISVTPSGINAGVYEITINAKDLAGSGIDYLAVSVSGAEYITESIRHTDEAIINLAVEGITTLAITAVDVAGNTTTMTHEVIVPQLFTDIGDPVSTPASVETPKVSEASGGGSVGLLWLLLATMMLCLRRSQLHINNHSQV